MRQVRKPSLSRMMLCWVRLLARPASGSRASAGSGRDKSPANSAAPIARGKPALTMPCGIRPSRPGHMSSMTEGNVAGYKVVGNDLYWGVDVGRTCFRPQEVDVGRTLRLTPPWPERADA